MAHGTILIQKKMEKWLLDGLSIMVIYIIMTQKEK